MMENQGGKRQIREASAKTGRLGDAPRRKMTIVEAIRWAWRDELPKDAPSRTGAAAMLAARSAWASIDRYGELHALIDRPSNQWLCVPFDEPGEVHPDARAIADAVMALDGVSLEVPDGWDPLPEIAAADADLKAAAIRDGLARLGGTDGVFRSLSPKWLVLRLALTGRLPDWVMDTVPVADFERGPNGKQLWFVKSHYQVVSGQNPDGTDRVVTVSTELDGWSKTKCRPRPGAFRRRRFDIDMVPIVVERGEWEALCAALSMLEEQVSGILSSIALHPLDWPVRPWEGEAMPSGPRLLVASGALPVR